MTEQLRINRKIQQQYYQHDTAKIVVINEEDYEQPFVHIPRLRQERYGLIPMMVQPREPKQRWDSIFKIEFPEFDGSLNHEEFVDWLNQVEDNFVCYDMPKSTKVKLAATNLRGKARSW